MHKDGQNVRQTFWREFIDGGEGILECAETELENSSCVNFELSNLHKRSKYITQSQTLDDTFSWLLNSGLELKYDRVSYSATGLRAEI